MSRFLPLYALLKEYRIGFFFVFIALTILLLVAPILLHMDRYFDYFSRMQCGFVPSIYAEIPTDTDIAKLRSHVAEIAPQAMIYTGVKASIDNAVFVSPEGRSLRRTLDIIGLDFRGDRKVMVSSGRKQMACTVTGMVRMDSWLLTLDGCTALPSGKVSVSNSERIISGELFSEENNESLLVLDNTGRHEADRKAVDQFLLSFMGQFFSMQHSGVGMNRFLIDDKTQASEFEIFQQRPIQAFSEIIFAPALSGEAPAVLVSVALMKEIGEAGIGGFSQLENPWMKTEVRVVDSFSYNPEAHLNPYLVLTSAESVRGMIPKQQALTAVLLVQTDSKTSDVIQEFLHKVYPELVLLDRHLLQPGYLLQQKYIRLAKNLLLSFILVIPPLILFVKFLRFYIINNDQVILLALYGFRWPIFATTTALIAVVAFVLAWGGAQGIFAFNNQLLNKYFFPPVNFEIERGLSIFGYVGAVVAALLVAEIIKLRRIRFSERGVG